MSKHPSKSISIMIVDDNEIDLFVASHLIKGLDFTQDVKTFQTAEEGLKHLDSIKFDLDKLPDFIFVDIYMPIVSGFDFCKAYDLYPQELKDRCKLYVISSSNDLGDIETILKDKNVVGFKEKPISKEFLDELI